MIKLYVLLLAVFSVSSCRDKDGSIISPVHPPMRYTELNNVTVKFNQFRSLNIDNDNTNDFTFSTLWVGDPVLKRDRKQYYINSSFDAFLLVDDTEQTPVLNRDDLIRISDQPGYHWYNAGSVVLAEKIIEENGPAHWDGNWKNASHKYIPVQVKKNDQRYNGWVEVSFNTAAEELVLHRAAIATQPGADVKAGR